ncbi:MAG: hypothetical protein JWO40_169 [Candidatus Doudnabacteria bacterium]|nr:hypothetical protein [Candidatus Doudnabacteria bacterium]
MKKERDPWENSDDNAWNPEGIHSDSFKIFKSDESTGAEPGQPQTFEKFKRAEKNEQIVRERAAAAAALLREDAFLILRLLTFLSEDQIANRLSITPEEIAGVRASAERIATVHLLRWVPNLDEAMHALAEYGYQTRCSNCGFFQHEDLKYCVQCGKPNSEFDARIFLQVRGNSYEEECAGECHVGHPIAIKYRCVGYCNLCGTDLAPILGQFENDEEL